MKKKDIKWWKERGYSPSTKSSLVSSVTDYSKKKKTLTKVKNGGKTKSRVKRGTTSTTSTTLGLTYPYTFIKLQLSFWERLKRFIYG